MEILFRKITNFKFKKTLENHVFSGVFLCKKQIVKKISIFLLKRLFKTKIICYTVRVYVRLVGFSMF